MPDMLLLQAEGWSNYGDGFTTDPAVIERWSAEMEGREPQEILRWAVEEFQPGLTMAASFGLFERELLICRM